MAGDRGVLPWLFPEPMTPSLVLLAGKDVQGLVSPEQHQGPVGQGALHPQLLIPQRGQPGAGTAVPSAGGTRSMCGEGGRTFKKGLAVLLPPVQSLDCHSQACLQKPVFPPKLL